MTILTLKVLDERQRLISQLATQAAKVIKLFWYSFAIIGVTSVKF
jgi:hypothetical protein